MMRTLEPQGLGDGILHFIIIFANLFNVYHRSTRTAYDGPRPLHIRRPTRPHAKQPNRRRAETRVRCASRCVKFWIGDTVWSAKYKDHGMYHYCLQFVQLFLIIGASSCVEDVYKLVPEEGWLEPGTRDRGAGRVL
jgi:hypothetical protein